MQVTNSGACDIFEQVTVVNVSPVAHVAVNKCTTGGARCGQ